MLDWVYRVGEMVIYTATCKVNGKKYVGQTRKKRPQDRWSGHFALAKSKKRGHTCAFLNAIRKHGREAFIFEVIDTATCIEELNIKEAYFADMLNTYVPNGYNLRGCGDGHEMHAITADRLAKDWKFLSPEGNIVEVHNLDRFCRDRGLSHGHMAAVARGQRYSSGGWRSANRPYKVWHLIHGETGQRITIPDIRGSQKKQALKMGVKQTSINNLLKGRIISTGGWLLERIETQGGGSLPERATKRVHSKETRDKIAASHGKGKIYRLLDNSTLTVHIFSNISSFCHDKRLSPSSISIILGGSPRYSRHRSWSLVEKPMKQYLLRHKDGREVVVLDKGGKSFCRTEKIGSPQRFFQMLRGELPFCKGWKLIKAFIPETTNLPEITYIEPIM